MRAETFNNLKWSHLMDDFELGCYYAAMELRDNGAALRNLTTKEIFGATEVAGEYARARLDWGAAQKKGSRIEQTETWVKVNQFRELQLGSDWVLVVDKDRCNFFDDDEKIFFEFGSIANHIESDLDGEA